VYSSACVRSFQVSPTDQLVQLQKETHLQGNKTSEILRPNQLKNIECPALPGRSLTASCAKSPYSWLLPAQDCLERLLGLACCTIRSEEPTRSVHCLSAGGSRSPVFALALDNQGRRRLCRRLCTSMQAELGLWTNSFCTSIHAELEPCNGEKRKDH